MAKKSPPSKSKAPVREIDQVAARGELLELLSDGNPGATDAVERAFATGNPVPFEVLMRSGGTICPWLASVTFGGPDLKTVYLGGLRSTNIPAFDSPIAGLPLAHW